MTQQRYAAMRAENRIDMKVTALLVGKQEKMGVETGLTADVSSRGVKVIVCPVPQMGGLGEALRDRLEKAARSK